MKRPIENIPVAVAQMRVAPGNIRKNLENILKYISAARERGAKIIVFPELIVPGYLLGDRWEHDAFIKEIESANEEIRTASQGLVVVWGSIRADWDRIGEDGRVRKYNAALIAQNGEWVTNGTLKGWIPKTNLPKYRFFDDARHFYPAAKLAEEMKVELPDLLRPFEVRPDGTDAVRLALAVCEDLWEDEYNIKPSLIYGKHGADLLIDISSSPWTAGKWRARERMLRRRFVDTGIPILYVNTVGLQNNTKNLILFDGDSSLIDQGEFCWRAPQHEEGLFVFDLASLKDSLKEDRPSLIAEIHGAIIAGMREFFAPFPKVVIGLSGGIDSALSAALLVEALGAGKVLAINMPTHFNSTTTRDLAVQCAKNLGVEYKVVPIEDLYQAHRSMLSSAGFANPESLVLENIQARIRGASVQATVAQAVGGVFICNGNKTEVALNYFTLYGDGAGAAAFLGDLWKGQVYELARFINECHGSDVIPKGILEVVPSAELSSEQNVDEGKGDPIFYPYHDELLKAFIERRWDPTTVLESARKGTLEKDLGCEPGTIKKYFPNRASFITNLVWAWEQYTKEFKRHQLPPVFVTSRRAFGFDRRDTIASGYFTRRYHELKDEYLKEAELPV